MAYEVRVVVKESRYQSNHGHYQLNEEDDSHLGRVLPREVSESNQGSKYTQAQCVIHSGSTV